MEAIAAAFTSASWRSRPADSVYFDGAHCSLAPLPERSLFHQGEDDASKFSCRNAPRCRGDGHDPTSEPGSSRSFLGIGPGWSTAANSPFRLHKSWNHEGGVSTPLIVQWPAGLAVLRTGTLGHSYRLRYVFDRLAYLHRDGVLGAAAVAGRWAARPLLGRSVRLDLRDVLVLTASRKDGG